VYIEASHAPVVYICNDNDDIKQPQEQEGRSERDENIEDDYGIDNHQSDTGFSFSTIITQNIKINIHPIVVFYAV